MAFKLDKGSASTLISELEGGIERYMQSLNKNIRQCDMQNAEVVAQMHQIVKAMNKEIRTIKSDLEYAKGKLVEE